MKINRYEDMNLQELDVMKEIGSIGTSHAATALSQLLQREVRITIPKVKILGYNGAVKRIGNEEEIVGATLVQMSGDLNGLMLFLYDRHFAKRLLKKLLEKDYEDFHAMDDMAFSALILTVPMVEFGYETDKLMYCNADFLVDGKSIPSWLLMLPDIDSLNTILGKLGV